MPWASANIDATTLHRLRLPEEDVEAILARGRGGIVWEGEEVHGFSPYFSRREASQLQRLLLFPLVSNDSVQAVLLILATSYFQDQTDYLRLILAAVGETAAQVVQKQRLRYMDIMRHAVVFKAAELEVLAERLTNRAPRGVHLIRLDLADIVSQVVSENAYLDPHRVWQDILRIVASLFASSGSVCDLERQNLLLLLHGSLENNLDLIVHHIGVTIAELLPELSDVPVVRFESRSYPADGADLLELATSLI